MREQRLKQITDGAASLGFSGVVLGAYVIQDPWNSDVVRLIGRLIGSFGVALLFVALFARRRTVDRIMNRL